ncbi:MAG: hypothetical protein ABFD50_11895 [Smithella sp.]
MQLKKHSLLESIVNVAVGYGVALLSQVIIFPVFGIKVTIRDNILIGLFFTVISIARSYVLRRIFNKLTSQGAA